jgi:DNA-binding MarR family transcriptional regulator
MRAWRSLVGAHHDLMATLDAELVEQFGVSMSEYEVLVVLSEQDGRRLRMTDLAEWLNLSPSGLTRRLDTVVSRGWVAREKCPSDRRGTYAVLTDPGYGELQRIAPTHVASVRAHFIDRLTPEQLDALADALSEVRGACPKELSKNVPCEEALVQD